MEITFSIFLNFSDVVSMFFYVMMSFLYFCLSMFCRSAFRHRSIVNTLIYMIALLCLYACIFLLKNIRGLAKMHI